MRRGGSAPPDDGHRIFINCHSEERSDVGIRFLLCGNVVRGEYGLPRAFHALAMTGVWWGAADGGTVHTFFIFFPVAKFVEKFYNV